MAIPFNECIKVIMNKKIVIAVLGIFSVAIFITNNEYVKPLIHSLPTFRRNFHLVTMRSKEPQLSTSLR
jgi:hypothetical protein